MSFSFSLQHMLFVNDTFNVPCELSQPMGMTVFFSTAKIRTHSVSLVRKDYQTTSNMHLEKQKCVRASKTSIYTFTLLEIIPFNNRESHFLFMLQTLKNFTD